MSLASEVQVSVAILSSCTFHVTVQHSSIGCSTLQNHYWEQSEFQLIFTHNLCSAAAADCCQASGSSERADPFWIAP